MISNTHNDSDLETLSALFDGELQPDTARFAIKRLGRDPQWRQALGNWQLLGDALRGQASTAAPAGFATRVAAAVSAEPVAVAVPAMASAPTVPGAPAATLLRRRWIGGAALAASVAMVAMFVARPFSQDPATMPESGTPSPSELVVAPTSTPVEISAAVRSSPADTAPRISTAAVAVAAVPRRAAERRSRGQSQRAALRAPTRQVAAPAIASAASATAVAVDDQAQDSTANPFRPQHAEVVSRPWPRAVLSAAPASGAFTARYGSSTAGSPSFYPFEPRLPNAADGASAPLDAGELRP